MVGFALAGSNLGLGVGMSPWVLLVEERQQTAYAVLSSGILLHFYCSITLRKYLKNIVFFQGNYRMSMKPQNPKP